jgi:hypothetical protein|tara:strand:+ start:301 stop:474 length:174 start_codon:yes stop_codon:yes gene_type:complete
VQISIVYLPLVVELVQLIQVKALKEKPLAGGMMVLLAEAVVEIILEIVIQTTLVEKV